MVGHVHARSSTDTSGPAASPRVKRRLRSKTSLAEIERQERGRSRIPEVPRLRTLNRDPAEGSIVPATSPGSGVNRAHPYTPVGNAVGSSSSEMVPAAVDRLASERGLSDSMETVPILRSYSSPSIIQNPSREMALKITQKWDFRAILRVLGQFPRLIHFSVILFLGFCTR